MTPSSSTFRSHPASARKAILTRYWAQATWVNLLKEGSLEFWEPGPSRAAPMPKS